MSLAKQLGIGQTAAHAHGGEIGGDSDTGATAGTATGLTAASSPLMREFWPDSLQEETGFEPAANVADPRIPAALVTSFHPA